VAPLLPLAFTISRTLSRRLQEAGVSAAVLGALVLIWGSATILRAMASRNGVQRPERTRERIFTLIGFVLVGGGFALQFMANLTRIFR